MKIGIIYTGFNQSNYIDKSLSPWILARGDKLCDCEFVISAVSVQFQEYKNFDVEVDDSTEKLRDYYNNHLIDHLVSEPQFIKESEARNLALNFLKENQCDVFLLVDSDEIWTTEQIERLISYIHLNQWISWFGVSYRNFVFNEKTYLVEPFTPPRVFRNKTNGFVLDKFYHDNDISYRDYNGQVFDYKSLPTKVIPANICLVDHYSWLSNEHSKNKVAYQLSHFGGICSYSWNESKNCLEFNQKFFQYRGMKLPEIATL